MSRALFETLIPDNESAFISIFTPGCSPAKAAGRNWIAGLVWCRADDEMPMDQREVRMIANFVETWRQHDFVVHCDAGISRSAAVAQYIGAVLDREVIGLDSDGLHANAVIKASLMHHLWETQFKEDHIERLVFKKT